MKLNKLICVFLVSAMISYMFVNSDGVFDLNAVKNKFLQWNANKFQHSSCSANGSKLLSLLNIVCSTAQATNTTARDACYNCFARVSSMTESPQIVSALAVCAIQYFTNTSYAACANSLVAQSTSSVAVTVLIHSLKECNMGYCDFVRCLKRVNSLNLIIQCTREARTGVNITLDADNVRFFTNVTSCILAKTRCGSFNPITGEAQTPGYSTNGVRISNALQIAASGDLRVLAFPANMAISNTFCSSSTSNLTQSSWLTNIC